jgi:hypothetical protein
MSWRRTLPAVFSACIERLMGPSERQETADICCCGYLRIPPFAQNAKDGAPDQLVTGIDPKSD